MRCRRRSGSSYRRTECFKNCALELAVTSWSGDVEPCRDLMTPPLHVVLVNPEIHWNTGNAGRSCLAAGATLHLVKPLGFSLDERELRRAGLDYWEHVDLRLWE